MDWGDGTTDTYTGTVTATHTYPAEVGPLIPNYVVTIRGDFPRIYFNNGGDKDKIRTIRQWGTNVWSSMAGSFAGCTNLTIETGAGQPDLSKVTSMAAMFQGATSFNQPIGDWDVSNVTDMANMFQNASEFNQPIGGNQPLGGWDVSSVTDMTAMFNNARMFDQDLGAWDVGKVETMRDMFNGVTLSTANYDSLLIGWSMIEDGETELRERCAFPRWRQPILRRSRQRATGRAEGLVD